MSESPPLTDRRLLLLRICEQGRGLLPQEFQDSGSRRPLIQPSSQRTGLSVRWIENFVNLLAREQYSKTTSVPVIGGLPLSPWSYMHKRFVWSSGVNAEYAKCHTPSSQH